MYQTTKSALSQLKQLCPNQKLRCSLLESASARQNPILNLGNIIVCPQYRSILIFKQRKLMEIETFSA